MNQEAALSVEVDAAGAFDSTFADFFVSVAGEALEPAEVLSAPESDVESDLEEADALSRESVAYQPPPLNTTAGVERMRLAVPLPHSSHL